MIQKCPKCGEWVVGKSGLIDQKFGIIDETRNQVVDDGYRIGKKLSGFFKKNIGENTGNAVESVEKLAVNIYGVQLGNVLGFAKSISHISDGFCFRCPRCGNCWNSDSESMNQENEYFESLLVKFRSATELERRLVYIDSQSSYVMPPKSRIFVLNQFPEELHFVGERPLEKTLYISHPCMPNVYIPFEKYRMHLFEEELLDLTNYIISLGASYIKRDGHTLEKRAEHTNFSFKENLSGSYGAKSAELNGGYSSESKEYSRICKEHSRESTFINPKYDPEFDLESKWSKISRIWNDITYSRQRGEKTCRISLTTKNSITISKNEIIDIEAEYKAIAGEVKSNTTIEMFEELKQDSEYVFNFEVEFSPLPQ